MTILPMVTDDVVECAANAGDRKIEPDSQDVAHSNRRVGQQSKRNEQMAGEIPFNKPYIVGSELHYIAKALTSGRIAADGEFTNKCARLMEERFGILKVLMTPSCTASLEIAAQLAGVGPGDEVILPSYTFVSTANAFVRLGARPVFVDIRPDTMNIDEKKIEAAITPATKAICPVHYSGVGCNMIKIMEIAERHGLTVVEDAAQGVNAWYQDQALGSIAQFGAFSFHDTKNFVCGEGGALCINDPEAIVRAEIIRDKGTNRKQFLRGEIDKYTWVDIGSSYVPSEINCAFLYAQLEQMDQITARRREIAECYDELLHPLVRDGLIRLPAVPEDCVSNHHLYCVFLQSVGMRDGLMAHLKKNRISAVFHYVPLHLAPMGRAFGYEPGDLPVTENLSARLLRLPMYYEIAEGQQREVVRQIGDHLDTSRIAAAA